MIESGTADAVDHGNLYAAREMLGVGKGSCLGEDLSYSCGEPVPEELRFLLVMVHLGIIGPESDVQPEVRLFGRRKLGRIGIADRRHHIPDTVRHPFLPGAGGGRPVRGEGAAVALEHVPDLVTDDDQLMVQVGVLLVGDHIAGGAVDPQPARDLGRERHGAQSDRTATNLLDGSADGGYEIVVVRRRVNGGEQSRAQPPHRP
ncbi:hypothetical protein ACWEN3_11590 [Streptomyces sp. NPDC004561]